LISSSSWQMLHVTGTDDMYGPGKGRDSGVSED
jgi:hypothetical protein